MRGNCSNTFYSYAHESKSRVKDTFYKYNVEEKEHSSSIFISLQIERSLQKYNENLY